MKLDLDDILRPHEHLCREFVRFDGTWIIIIIHCAKCIFYGFNILAPLITVLWSFLMPVRLVLIDISIILNGLKDVHYNSLSVLQKCTHSLHSQHSFFFLVNSASKEFNRECLLSFSNGIVGF